MSDKITLEEIVGYLPYGLKVTYNNGETKDIISKMIGIEDENNILTEKHVVSMNFAFKPILRPLSDLTKEIEVNGERFVPIVELLRLCESNHFSKDDMLKRVMVNAKPQVINFENKYYSSGTVTIYQVKYAIETSNMGTLVNSFSYDDRFDRFSKRDETRGINLGVGHQLQLFQKLYQWHFDIHNLINRNLAIDINTIKL